VRQLTLCAKADGRRVDPTDDHQGGTMIDDIDVQFGRFEVECLAARGRRSS
jgi:hypothetical protein